MKYFLPNQLYSDIYSAKWFCIILLFVIGFSILFFTAKKKYLNVLISYILYVFLLNTVKVSIFYHPLDFLMLKKKIAKCLYQTGTLSGGNLCKVSSCQVNKFFKNIQRQS